MLFRSYQPYRTLMKKSDMIQAAGCYAHARRKFTEIIKAAKKDTPPTPGQTVATEAVKRIDAMYHLDNIYKESSEKERLDNRQRSVKPLADAYFTWLKPLRGKTNTSSKLKRTSIIRSIRKYISEDSWHIIDSTKGAKGSALLYSIAESAKSNSLKPSSTSDAC